ncbi:MAG: hypothetical protein IJ583_13710 [Firmicutes bacterium]|nr:hypothetical protein [Bacillota bacterium]
MDNKNPPKINTDSVSKFIVSYFKYGVHFLKNPLKLIPTVLMCLVWFILSIWRAYSGRLPLPLGFLSCLTFSQGGMYGGFIGAIGGIIGRMLVILFLNTIIMPLFSKEKRKKQKTQLKGGIKAIAGSFVFNSLSSAVPFLFAIGLASFVYGFLNLAQTRENLIVGLMTAVMLIKNISARGFVWNFIISLANTFSKKKKLSPDVVRKIISGLALGFTATSLSNIFGIKLSIFTGILLIIISVILFFVTKNKKSGIKTAAFIILLSATFSSVAINNNIKAENDGYMLLKHSKNDEITWESKDDNGLVWRTKIDEDGNEYLQIGFDDIPDTRTPLEKFLDFLDEFIANTNFKHLGVAGSALVDFISTVGAVLLSLFGGGYYDPFDDYDLDHPELGFDEPSGFFDENDSDTVRNSVRENDDGTLSVYDAPTGQWRTFYPVDDPEKGRMYESDTGTVYSPDFLKEHIETRNENETLKQDYRQAQEHLNGNGKDDIGQRAQNQQNYKKEQDYWDAVNAEKQRQLYEEQQKEAYYQRLLEKDKRLKTNDHTLMTMDNYHEFYKNRAAEAKTAHDNAMNRDKWLGRGEMAVGAVKAVNDAAADAVGRIPIVGAKFHAAYTGVTNITESVTEAVVTGGSVSKGIAKGIVNAGVTEGQYYASGGTGKYAGMVKAGAFLGGEGVRTTVNDLIDGKDVKTALKNGAKDSITKGGSKLALDYVSGKVFGSGSNAGRNYGKADTDAWNKSGNIGKDIIKNNWRNHDDMEKKLEIMRSQISKAAYNNKVNSFNTDVKSGAAQNIGYGAMTGNYGSTDNSLELGDKMKK